MAKLTLEIEEDYDFELIGICSHAKDYRLSWELNQRLRVDLIKDENLELTIKGERQSHSFFSFIDDENLIEYYLINNRSENGKLIPEEKRSDYFLLIRGVLREGQIGELIGEIATIKNILTTYEIEVEQLKSKDNLLF
ncbi:MAG: IPExxxVDY family protein [Flavobacteriales bacterium]|nr:IPExxxVDY family protein [Flavobacteriales bacterium]